MALVRTDAGALHECAVANLSERGAFLRTAADIGIRQELKVELLDLVVRAHVLFVCSEPKGVVVAFDADLEARTVLMQAEDDVEVLPGQGVEIGDPWGEDTAAGVVLDADASSPELGEATMEALDAIDIEEPIPPTLSADDLMPFEPEPAAEEASDGLDPMLFAAAMIDDSSGQPPGDALPMLEPLDAVEPGPLPEISVDLSDLADFASDLADPGPSTAAEAADPLPVEALIPELAEADLSEPALPESAPPEPEVPVAEAAQVLIPDPPAPAADIRQTETELPPVKAPTPAPRAVETTPPPASVEMRAAPAPASVELPAAAPAAPAPAATSPEPEPLEVEGDPVPTTDLPSLERDGFTVNFESVEAYKAQFEHSLKHGGLVVSADALAIGTQRMLALKVPGADVYTVSARVVFYETGKLGFMLDSFALHRNRLQGLAG